MIPVLSREEMRRFDAHASTVDRVPSLLLMENAGRGAAQALEAAFGASNRRVLVVCGSGNNGGDGFVVARRLHAAGASVRAVLLVPPERLKGDALVNADAFRGVGGQVTNLGAAELAQLESELASAELIVDAIFGTGLDRKVEGFFAEVIERINAASAPRASLDVPSGLDSDTGAALGVAVRADLTVTFAHPKRGLLTPGGALFSGRLEVVDIGVPGSLAATTGYGAELVEPSDVQSAVGRRDARAHKGSSGRVLVLAGSPGKLGAALLVAHGALRAGAGLVTLGARPEVASALELRVLEAMTARIDPAAPEAALAPLLENTDVVALGPGLGLDELATKLVDHVLFAWDGVKVVDADAITRFQGRAGELARARGALVLTPHPGEMGRLLGLGAAEVEADRFAAVERAVALTRATVLLKGAHTLVGSPGERIAVVRRGTTALATGGAGDVLCGVTSALAVVTTPRRAAFAAASLHARAAELWAERHGSADRGLLAHEIADLVPDALAELAARSMPLTS